MEEQPRTTFSNEVVALDAIPDHAAVEFLGVAASFRRYVVVSTLSVFGPLLAVAAALVAVPWVPLPVVPGLILIGLLVLAGLLTVAYRRVDAGRRGYAVREHDVLARSGVLWRSVTALPVARIQHVETTHGPLERWHGLARLKLYTAGGLTADLVIVGLEREAADRLREYLVEQIRRRDDESGRHE